MGKLLLSPSKEKVD